MEAQIESVAPNDTAELRYRITILETGIAGEQAKRRNAEAERDKMVRELASLKDEAEHREKTARRAIEVAQEQIARLESEIARERSERHEVEAERNAAHHELVSSTAAADQHEERTYQETDAQREHAAPTQTVTNSEPSPASPAAPHPGSTTGAEQPVSPPPAQSVPAPAGTQLTVVTNAQQNVEGSTADVATSDGSEKRRDPRVPSRLPATYWHAGMIEALRCTICDKSSGGARLELTQGSNRHRGKALAVGDQFTLSFDTALESTSVVCVVMWIAGNRCGVRFFGQFHSTRKSTRTAPRIKQAPKAASGGMLSKWRSGTR